jgi:hypothetical protein
VPDLSRDVKTVLILDPVVQKMLDELAADGGPPVYTLTPTQARGTLVRLQSRSVREADARIRDWRRRQMRDPKEIEELEAEIARDKKRLSEIERLERELLANIPHQGFAAASQERRLRDEKESLADSIRRAEKMLVDEKSRRN